jgi:hypothetical protein
MSHRVSQRITGETEGAASQDILALDAAHDGRTPVRVPRAGLHLSQAGQVDFSRQSLKYTERKFTPQYYLARSATQPQRSHAQTKQHNVLVTGGTWVGWGLIFLIWSLMYLWLFVPGEEQLPEHKRSFSRYISGPERLNFQGKSPGLAPLLGTDELCVKASGNAYPTTSLAAALVPMFSNSQSALLGVPSGPQRQYGARRARAGTRGPFWSHIRAHGPQGPRGPH